MGFLRGLEGREKWDGWWSVDSLYVAGIGGAGWERHFISSSRAGFSAGFSSSSGCVWVGCVVEWGRAFGLLRGCSPDGWIELPGARLSNLELVSVLSLTLSETILRMQPAANGLFSQSPSRLTFAERHNTYPCCPSRKSAAYDWSRNGEWGV